MECTLPSATADDDLIYYPNPASDNYNSARVDSISESSPLIPVIVSDFPCPPTINYFSYRDIYPQVGQIIRLNEAVDPNGSHGPFRNVADTSMANSMPAGLENSYHVVYSISEQLDSFLMPIAYYNDNEDIYDYMTIPGSAEDLLNLLSSDNYPNESDLKEVHQHDPGLLRYLQFENTDQNLTTLPNHPSNNLRRSSSQANLVGPEVVISSNPESGMPNVVKPISGSDLGKAPLESDMNQVNGQNKRKKVDENDSCKRCKCKKSKCLKLYCDCFAAGVYCADSCACQGCFNKPMYENTVVETRQQIKSRNPFAFSPKVVKQYATSAAPNNGDNVNLSTADSGRHKRGCNCKKSLCQKKYCECYEGNVGCSLECRCEGCQNIFGKKEDYKHTKDVDLDQNFNESNNATQNVQPHNSPFLAPSFLYPGSNVGGNQHATTSPNEPFQSQMAVTSSTKPALGNSSNLIYPENDGFPFTSFPQLGGSLTHISQFNGMKAQYAAESDNTVQTDNTPDILKDKFNHLSNSANVMSPMKKRVSPPYTAHGSSSVSVMRSSRNFNMFPLPPIVPMNDDGR